jgi:hypothetical protein
MTRKNKKGIEMTFAWMFSIIAGAVILFLAIYAASRLIKTAKYEVSTVTAKELSIIFEPMETGIASGKSIKASLSEETRIFNDCYDDGIFGEQRISLAVKKGKQWSKPGAEIPINNKYIFSNATTDGKKIYIFGMPFEFPFKVADIIILTTRGYCFVNSPDAIQDELGNLNLDNMKFEVSNCTKDDIRVCFGSSFGTGGKCDITVYGTCSVDCESDFDEGYVMKEKKNIYFSGRLIYPAIFSSPELYECNLKRLAKKAMQLALLYKDEANWLSTKCGTVSSAELANFGQQLNALKDSKSLMVLSSQAKSLDNQMAECELW